MRLSLILIVFFALGPSSAAFAERIPIPVGTEVVVRTLDPIQSRQTETGQSYRCTVDAPVFIDGRELLARGADCILRVLETKDAGRLSGHTELKLELTQLRIDRDLVDVTSDAAAMESASKGKGSAAKTGIGAAAGAGLGALLGGKKGAAIGAGAGTGAGLATAALTHGPEIKVASETVLQFVLR